MGAFVLHKNNSNILISSVQQLMHRKGFSDPHTFDICGYTLYLYDKILIKERNFIFRDNHGLFISGSVCYKGAGYQSSIDALFADLLNQKLDHGSLQGVFCLLFFDGKKIQLLTDQAGIQNIYYNDSATLISSSFLALIEGMPEKLKPNKLAIAECITNGTLIGPDTFFHHINRYEFHARPEIENLVLLNPPNNSLNVSFIKGSFDEAVSEQVNILKKYFDNIKNIGTEYGVDSGITGGHDSRLILTLAKDLFKNISFHSHWRNVKDKELACAELVCEKAGIVQKTVKVKYPFEMTEEEAEETFNSSMLFYDGHARMHCYFNESYNTIGYRTSILGDKRLGLNGIGGEQYRNDEHMMLPKWNIHRWVKHQLIRYGAGKCFSSPTFEKELDNYIEGKIKRKLLIENKSAMTRLDLKRYLNEVFIPAGMGARNNAENQLSFFFSPYSDFKVSQAAYRIVYHLGISFDFEEAMIGKINPEIAAVMSDYGFSFISGEPAKRKVFHLLKELLPFVYKSNYSNKRALHSGNKYATGLLNKLKVNKDSYHMIERLDLPVNLERLTYKSDLFGIVLSLGYLLKTYEHKISFSS